MFKTDYKKNKKILRYSKAFHIYEVYRCHPTIPSFYYI